MVALGGRDGLLPLEGTSEGSVISLYHHCFVVCCHHRPWPNRGVDVIVAEWLITLRSIVRPQRCGHSTLAMTKLRFGTSLTTLLVATCFSLITSVTGERHSRHQSLLYISKHKVARYKRRGEIGHGKRARSEDNEDPTNY